MFSYLFQPRESGRLCVGGWCTGYNNYTVTQQCWRSWTSPCWLCNYRGTSFSQNNCCPSW